MKWLGTIIFVSSVSLGAVFAEEMLITPEKAVELAIANNLGLKNAGITLRGFERSKKTAWNSFLPSMQLNTGFQAAAQLFTSEGNFVPNLGEAGTIGISGGFSLGLDLNIAAVIGIKKILVDYEKSLIDYDDAQKKLTRDVQKLFYLILSSVENLTIRELNIELAEKRLEQTRSNYENGLVPELQVLSSEVNLEGLKPLYNKELMDYENSLLSLKLLLGLSRNQDIRLEGKVETDVVPLDAEALITSYRNKRLDIQQLNKAIESATYSKQVVTTNANSPTLRFAYNYDLRASNSNLTTAAVPRDPWSDLKDNSTFTLGLGWKLDGLIPGSSTHTAVKSIQDNIDILQNNLKQAQESADIEISNLVNGLEYNGKTIQATTFSVELARRNFELTEEAYLVGTKELLEVQSAQNDYLAAAQQLLLAKYAYIASLLDLEYALNVPMEDFLP